MISISAEHLDKSYKRTRALEDVSFHIDKGELFGFIGPDGSGKTTLIRILTTLIVPNAGYATVESLDVVKDYKKLRTILGYMPGRFSLYPDLTVEENLEFYASIFDTTIHENYHLIRDIYLQIEPFKNRLAGKLSGGMKQKLALSCAMIHKPTVLVLDEPTTGVDAVSRVEFWEMLKKLKSEGVTIVVSTPYMEEAGLCDRVALMQFGKIMKIAPPRQIIDEYRRNLFSVKAENTYKLIEDLQRFPETGSAFPFGQSVHFTPNSSAFLPKSLIDFLILNGHQNPDVHPIEPSIEDCFMELMSDSTNTGDISKP
ncbi:MAG: ATPase [Candidatus Marinimicrobia bacterium CG08_land_8_20_14_0_20_45_22]|nr:MAG: ATPase [Candidatus Marinimicrobia bacterium CG08_land_8_20_14_0_20_45_22]